MGVNILSSWFVFCNEFVLYSIKHITRPDMNTHTDTFCDDINLNIYIINMHGNNI